jgi:hypothetical protein
MGVSKQDWKNFQSQVWLGSCKQGFDALMLAFDGVLTAINTGDAPGFLAYTESGGNLMIAAQVASGSATDAFHAIGDLRLDGNQRRFANKSAIAASDQAYIGVDNYCMMVDNLVTELVRGVSIEHDTVAEDGTKIGDIKDGPLPTKLGSYQANLRNTFTSANGKVDTLAAIDKIGVV